MTAETHRLELEFDEFGVRAKLLHPIRGCETATICPECGSSAPGPSRCGRIDCPDDDGECWLQGWIDNVEIEEMLTGKVVVPIVAEGAQFDGDRIHIRIAEPARSEEDVRDGR